MRKASAADWPEHVHIVGNAQVSPDLVLLNVGGADSDDHLSLILELGEHSDLAVGGKAGEHPGGVIVVKKLAAELQIELAAELADPLLDMERLGL